MKTDFQQENSHRQIKANLRKLHAAISAENYTLAGELVAGLRSQVEAHTARLNQNNPTEDGIAEEVLGTLEWAVCRVKAGRAHASAALRKVHALPAPYRPEATRESVLDFIG